MYEVSTRICARLTREVRWISTTISYLPTFDGLHPLETLLLDIEESVPMQQRLLEMDEALKETQTRWWGTHKTNIADVDTERGVNQYQVQFKTFFNLYLNHSIISNEK
jgi:hypothetical protein